MNRRRFVITSMATPSFVLLSGKLDALEPPPTWKKTNEPLPSRVANLIDWHTHSQTYLEMLEELLQKKLDKKITTEETEKLIDEQQRVVTEIRTELEELCAWANVKIRWENTRTPALYREESEKFE